jgi:peroxiredoxin Q/BCP
MLNVGDTPEDFTLNDQDGQAVSWAHQRGHWVILFAYPKASTPGCTAEACAFRDLSSEFGALEARVFGISADSVKRQQNFTAKHTLNMPLLSDADHIVLEPWGIWAEKKNYGRTYMGIVRSTFLFNPAGVLVHAWRNLRVKGHVDKVLSTLAELQA